MSDIFEYTNLQKFFYCVTHAVGTRVYKHAWACVHVYVQADSQKIFVCSTLRASIMLSNQYFPWHRGISFIYCSFSSPFLLFQILSFSCRASSSLSSCFLYLLRVMNAYKNRPRDVYLRGKYSAK